MNIDLVLRDEQQKRKAIKKQAGKAVLISFFACSLVFVFQLLSSFVLAALTMVHNNLTVTAASLINIFLYVIYICIPFLIASLFFNHCLPKTTEFKFKRSSPRKPVLFVVGALGTTYLLNLLIALLFPSVNDLPSQTTIVANTPIEIVLSFVMYAVLPAIIEEWAFRGILLKHLLPYGKWGAIIISSVLFGLGHFINNAISTVIALIPLESLLAVLISLTLYVVMGCAIGAIVYYASRGYKRHRFSLKKPNVLGYKLSPMGYLNKFVFNIGIIPYILLFGLYFCLAFYI